MTTKVHSKAKLPCCSSKDGVLEAIRLMAERQVRRVLVLDESHRLSGCSGWTKIGYDLCLPSRAREFIYGRKINEYTTNKPTTRLSVG